MEEHISLKHHVLRKLKLIGIAEIQDSSERVIRLMNRWHLRMDSASLDKGLYIFFNCSNRESLRISKQQKCNKI